MQLAIFPVNKISNAMNNTFDRYVLRTPLLPFDVLRNITTKEQLFAFFEQPLMREAIYLASPVLYEELLKNKPDDKLVFSLMKYLQRAATRCTPFALFASCSVTETGADANPGVFSFTEKRHTRPDMNYLCALAQHIAADPLVREKLTYFPNTSFYKVGEKIRYTEYRFSGTSRRHQLTNVDASIYLDQVLHAAAPGKNIDALAAVISDEEISEAEAREFILELIDAQLLVSNLDPPVTGPEFLQQLIHELDLLQDPHAERYNAVLKQLHADLLALDNAPSGREAGEYRRIGEYLKPLGVTFDPKFLFQTDCFRETSFIAPGKTAADLHEGIAVLARLSANTENQNLKAFTDAFSARYDSREVPLTEALDTENGLGYPYSDSRQHDLSPLIEGIMPNIPASAAPKIQWTPTLDLLLKKITAAQANNGQVIAITDDDISGFPAEPAPLADTYASMCSVTSYDPATGNIQVLLNTAGDSSAVNLLGRFCHGDSKIEALCNDICAWEETLNPDVLLAEIVHLPESRIGNVLFRPVLRKYEIPYLAKSAVPVTNQLELNDLRLSVRNGRLVLRSARHNRMVVPRMGNAHNYSNQGLPVYHFLCDLQHHYSPTALGIDFDFFIRRFSFVPRIIYKNIIFAPASWQFNKADLGHLFNLDDGELPGAINRWRAEHGIPRYQLLPDSDNELFIDWSNLLSVRTLFDLIRKRDQFRFTEFLFDPEKPLLHNSSGIFTNQFVIPYKQLTKKQLLTELVSFAPSPAVATRREFQPGSEWLYFKIYTGIKSGDRILTELLLPFVQQLKTAGEIRTWFFIRYGDPRDHIRFRVQLTEPASANGLLERFHECLSPALENGLIAQLQLDTYQRELERYGADTIDLAEQLFETDSELALRIIAYLDGDYGDTLRWKISLLIIDAYFKAFRLPPETIVAFTGNQAAAFEAEFNIGKDQRIQIDKSYREKRSAVEYVLKGAYTSGDECMPLYELVNEYRLRLQNHATALYDKAGAETTFSFLPSFIHMSINRFFRSRQRFHELIIYTFLHKYYTSAVARQKKAPLTEKKAHV